MTGIADDILGQVGSLGKQVGATLVDESKKMAKTAASQVGVTSVLEKDKKEKAISSPENAAQKPEEAILQNKDTQDFVKELYGASKNSENAAQKPQELPKSTEAKTLEEQQKMASLRQQLQQSHRKYYENLVNRPKQKEIGAAEKVEREKQEENWELQEKEKKKPQPLAVTQAANKTEKFPGASG